MSGNIITAAAKNEWITIYIQTLMLFISVSILLGALRN